MRGLYYVGKKMTEEELALKLKEDYVYDPDSGLVTNARKRTGRGKAGDVVGTTNRGGYLVMTLNSKTQLIHRVAFLYMTGKWPTGFVDHRDTDRTNNRWSNLRDVDRNVNARNKSVQKNNSSGVVGVSWSSTASLWRADICVEGKQIWLGSFQHKEDAIFARTTAEKDYGYWVDKVWDQL